MGVKRFKLVLSSLVTILAILIPVFLMPFHFEQDVYFFDKNFAETPQLQAVELTVHSIGYRLFGIGYHSFERTFYNSTTLQKVPFENVIIYVWKTYKTVHDEFYTIWVSGNQTVVNSTCTIYRVYYYKTEIVYYSTTELFRDSDATVSIQWAINNTNKVQVTAGD